MGLDNIPAQYPCLAQKTAVIQTLQHNSGADTKIDCTTTKNQNGCPWQKTLGNKPGAVTGILGTSCWYRGKYGVHLLTALGLPGDDLYGDPTGLVTPEAALALADIIADVYSADDWERDSVINLDGRNVAADVWYLHDWLRWVAAECDGAIAWY